MPDFKIGTGRAEAVESGLREIRPGFHGEHVLSPLQQGGRRFEAL